MNTLRINDEPTRWVPDYMLSVDLDLDYMKVSYEADSHRRLAQRKLLVRTTLRVDDLPDGEIVDLRVETGSGQTYEGRAVFHRLPFEVQLVFTGDVMVENKI